MPEEMVLRRVRIGLGGPLGDVRLSRGRVAALLPPGAEADGAEVVDGRSGTLLPGLRDQHVHMSQWAIALQRIDLAAVTSAADAARQVARAAERRTDAGLVHGYGFRDGLWPDEPHKDILERAAPGYAVALVSNDLHTTWLSPAALQLLGMPQHPTGVLREQASFDVQARFPGVDDEVVDGFAMAAAQQAAERGVTQIMDFEFCDTIATWTRRCESHGQLPLRVVAALWRPLLDEAIASRWRTGDRVPGTDGRLTVGSCKVLIDGSLNSRTALCTEPYPGVADPATAQGVLAVEPEELVFAMRRGYAAGITFALHAIGDQANMVALDCFEAVGGGGRIEHAQLVADADVPRFAALGVVAGVQPAHAPEDRDVADRLWAGRTDRAFRYAALARAGAVLEFGSDAPVSRLDPWHAIACAVTRTVDDRPGWHPEQALTLSESIAAAAGGSTGLSVGMPADLTLVGRDPADLPPAALRDIDVLATLVGGRFTHRVI